MTRDSLVSKQTDLIHLLRIVLCENIASWCLLVQLAACCRLWVHHLENVTLSLFPSLSLFPVPEVSQRSSDASVHTGCSQQRDKPNAFGHSQSPREQPGNGTRAPGHVTQPLALSEVEGNKTNALCQLKNILFLLVCAC